MNDFNDTNQTQPTPDPAATGFCQNCGKPLTAETIRKVGDAVYCEPCLAARLGSTSAQGYRPVNTGAAAAGYGTGPAYGSDGWIAQNLGKAGPNPGLAALLGLIPGVGAMYNEQYAKGIVHLVVFAVLVSLADNVNGIFGLFVAGWVFYMAIEAHHTARARRDGTPLPNPFGLNDIGERLGFGKSWPTGPSVVEVANDAAAAAAQGFHQTTAAGQQPPPAAPWGAPVDSASASHATYPHPPFTQAPYAQVPFTQPGSAEAYAQAVHAQAYRDAGFVPPVPAYGSPYAAIPPYDPAAFVPQPSRFPAGAVWLIGLGTIFLLTTTGLFNGFPGEALIGCIMLGVGVWVFLRRMMETGTSFANDGTATYPLRVLRALRVSIWLGAIGLQFLLDAFHILTWHHSWPLLIILAGVMALLQRAGYQASASAYTPPASTSVVPPTPAAETNASAGTDISKGSY